MDMKKTMFRAHRGNVCTLPENTMPAFEWAVEQGFEYIETDPCFTKDNEIILFHDGTINRTCRNADGSEIDHPVYHKDLTYDELMEYDAGIYRGEKFRGVKVPKLSELLEAMEGRNVIVALDKKIPTDRLDELIDVVEKYNVRTSFSCADLDRIRKVQSRLPDALIDYDGSTREEDIKEVLKLVKYENLLVWAYHCYVEDFRLATPENCARVKKLARLGIGLVMDQYDLRKSLMMEPDVAEV